MKIFYSIVVVFFYLLGCQSKAQNKGEEIISAIHDGAQYASNVLLDEEGKSRCDYDMVSGTWKSYEEAWHTGQVIYGLVEAYKVTKNEAYLDAARKAGDWWISLEITEQPQLRGMLKASHGDKLGDLINFTTITDGSNGIFELHRVSGDDKYAETCLRAGEWMLSNLYIPEEAMFYNIVDPNTGDIWKDKSPHHPEEEKAKITQVARPNNEGYLYKDLYGYTANEKYKQVFIEVCDGLVNRQDENGLWMDFEPNDPKSGKVHPRFNLWYAESLLEGYELTKNQSYLEAAYKTAKAMANFQKKDGTIYYHNYTDGKYKDNSITGSATAFAGLIWMRLSEHGYKEFDEHIQRSLGWVLMNRFPIDHPDPNLRGGFLETRVRTIDGVKNVAIRDIATSFGLRFLSLYYKNYVLQN